MIKKILFILIAISIVSMCSKEKEATQVDPIVGSGEITQEDVLIEKKFLGKDSYLIVCKGFPPEGMSGVRKMESAKRAALLNVYYFIKILFDESIAPDKDGTAEKFILKDDYAIVHYVIKKKGLKGRVKGD